MNEPSEQSNNLAKNNELQEFIAESKARLKTILKRLKWDIEPFSLGKVAAKGSRGDDDSEPELPASCAASNSVVIDVEELRKIVGDPDVNVPKKFSDLQLNFTRQQKLAIYEHAVANTEKYKEPEISVPALGEEGLTFAEIVAQKKRETQKRRRYRQSKPTYIEKVRAMVDLQMQALQQYNDEKVEEKRKNHTYERHRQRTDRNRSPEMRKEHYRIRSRSRSRSTERKGHKSKRYRNRSVSKSYKNTQIKHRSRSRSTKHEYRKSKRHRSRGVNKSNKHTQIKHRSRSQSTEHEHHKSKRHRSRGVNKSNKHTQIKHRSRSCSTEHKDYKSKIHRSHSVSKSRKRSKHKVRIRDRISSRDKKVHKRRGRSRSKSKTRKLYKRRTRSTSSNAIHDSSHNRTNKVYHGISEMHGRL